MRILYVGPLWEGGACLQRLKALEALGHVVTAIDTEPAGIKRRRAGFLDRVAFRLGYPADLVKVNEQLLSTVSQVHPEIVWIDKGITIRRETLLQIRRVSARSQLVHYNPDDPFGSMFRAGWGTFLRALPEYDVHIVPRRINVSEYLAEGAKNVIHSFPAWGYDPETHVPRELSREGGIHERLGIGFIGGYEEDRAKQIQRLAKRGLDVHVWTDSRWSSRFHHSRVLISGAVYANDYAMTLSSLTIALCFLRKYNRDRHTSRSVEIPACGTFMLAERTEEHSELFKEGHEAEFFGSTEELFDKCRFYLSHDEARKRIADAGRKRCLESGYSNYDRMRLMLQNVMDRTRRES